MSEGNNESPAATMSIGALSHATGVPVETLRTWERRYGFPNPDRSPSGHRIYHPDNVTRVRLIDRALRAGNRAANVVPLAEEDLRALVALGLDSANRQPDAPAHEHIESWLQASLDFDGPRLEHLFRDAWLEVGALEFLNERVSPFLAAIGIAWAENHLVVAHEHFASEALRDFLASHWRPLSDRASGPIVVCATLPGEAHVLGLHMTALICANAGLRVINIGGDAPVLDVARTANDTRAIAVVISVSVTSNRFVARDELAKMRDGLHDNVELIVGGRGAPRGLPGVHVVDALDGLADWARKVS